MRDHLRTKVASLSQHAQQRVEHTREPVLLEKIS